MRRIRHHEFAVGLPDAWRDLSTVVLPGTPHGHVTPNLTITKEELDAPLTPAEYAARQLEVLREEFSDVGLEVVEEGPFRIAGIDAHQRTHHFTMPGSGVRMRPWQVFLVAPRLAITLTATDRADMFHLTLPEFETALAQCALPE